jgi:hypothetical protein
LTKDYQIISELQVKVGEWIQKAAIELGEEDGNTANIERLLSENLPVPIERVQ